MGIRLRGALVAGLALAAGAATPAAAAHGAERCSCHHAWRHVVHRRLVAREVAEAPPVVVRVIPAALAARHNAWEPRDVMGRMITPPTPGVSMDNDGTADYLGKGGTAAAVLHLPTLRGDIQR